jgi:hypothetical protein
MLRKSMFAIVLAATAATSALAQTPPQPPPPSGGIFEGTKEERAACAPDVAKFCKNTIPADPKAPVDVLAVSGCLRSNKAKISAACRTVLDGHNE